MKSVLVSLLMILSASASFAANHEPEFCKLGWDVEAQERSEKYFDVESIEVKNLKNISAFQLALVNNYLMTNEITSKALTLPEIKALFDKGGEEQFNELWIHIRTSKVSGEKHIEVMSYPGDNPVGTVFSVTGKVIGHNGDDSYSYITSAGEKSCSASPN